MTAKKANKTRIEKTAAKVTSAQKARANALFEDLLAAYPDAHCELNYRNPFELLIAVILSAQTTDVAVNKITPALFAKFPGPRELAAGSIPEIESLIKTIGLFRNKAKSIKGAAQMIVEEFGGEVPRQIGDLLKLPGVARKTANVVMSEAFGTALGVVVDTHVQRLSARFGFVPFGEPPPKIEPIWMQLLPQERWGMISHLLIWHGRRNCTARGGCCGDHPVCRKYGSKCEKRR